MCLRLSGFLFYLVGLAVSLVRVPGIQDKAHSHGAGGGAVGSKRRERHLSYPTQEAVADGACHENTYIKHLLVCSEQITNRKRNGVVLRTITTAWMRPHPDPVWCCRMAPHMSHAYCMHFPESGFNEHIPSLRNGKSSRSESNQRNPTIVLIVGRLLLSCGEKARRGHH